MKKNTIPAFDPDFPTTVVIACNNPHRPLARAVASVLEGNAGATVMVVAHNTDLQELKNSVPARYRDQIQWESCQDGVKSSASPYNAGLAACRTPWVAILGSDDEFAPGAVASWQAIARKTGAAMVITRSLLGEKQAITRTPVRRPLPHKLADFVKDRLAYRSAPLGLMHLPTVRRLGVRFAPGVPVGSDIPFSVQLFLQAPVAIQRSGPGYLIREDATDRVTYSPRPVKIQLEHVDALLDAPWLARVTPAQRHHIAIKTLRSHLFGLLYSRPDPAWWDAIERKDLADYTRKVLDFSPGCEQVLPLADYRLTQALLNPRVPATTLLELGQARRRFGHPDTWMAATSRGWLDREGPVRFALAALLIR